MLGPLDRLTPAPRRVLVAGVSGSGKTTLAARLATLLDVPHTEIDALFHGPDWTPRESFVADVDAFTAEAGWVTEWQYDTVRALLAERADTLVWLDLPFRVTLQRVVARTLRRRLRRQELWNGNVEGPLWTFFVDPEHIVRWAISTRRNYRASVPALEAAHPTLRVVRVASSREAERWLERLADTR